MKKQLLKKNEEVAGKGKTRKGGFNDLPIIGRGGFCARNLMAFALAGIIVAGVAQVAEGHHHQPPAAGAGVERQELDKEGIEARQQFFEQTQELRRQMVVKKSLLQAQKNSAKPDFAEVERLAGGLFDLRQQMREQAKEAGMQCMGKGACGSKGAGGKGHCKGKR